MSNITLNAGSGGATLATDQVAGTDYQKVKVTFSTDGIAPVSVDASNGLPVSVINTHPVTQSGTWTITVSNASLAVTGTFWQTTQPVSIATMPTTPVKPDGTVWTLTSTSANVNVSNTTIAVTQSGTWNIGSITTLPALAAGTNRIGSVRPVDSADADLTAAKLSQTSRFLGVQEAKDSGRTNLQFYATAVAAGTTGTETAITLTKSSDTGATSTAATFVITSGKRFRITSVTFATRGNATATAQVTTFSLRINTAGAVTTTSTPIVLQVRSATPATANAWDRFQVPIPDGLEFTGNGTIQFGVTAAAVYTTNAPTWDVFITGFEY